MQESTDCREDLINALAMWMAGTGAVPTNVCNHGTQKGNVDRAGIKDAWS